VSKQPLDRPFRRPPRSDPTPADWAKLAREHLQDAEILLNARSFRNAYAHAGHALEFALKARIMRDEGLNRWPSYGERKELHTHNLGELLTISRLRANIEAEIIAGNPLGLAWLVVKDFDINRRYPDGQIFPWRVANDFVKAARDDGVLEWLIKGL
jgi:HEPN domain-containing protein